MSLSESIRQLEEQVRRTVESAMEGVRDQLLERLQQQSQQLRDQVQSLDVDLPEGLLPADQLQGWLDDAVAGMQPPAAPAAGPATLLDAASAIDQARSQSQVLQALLSHSEAFAGRAAVFLAQPGLFQGWGGRGFGDGDSALRQVSLGASPGSGWALLLDDDGAVRLGSTDRAGLASQLEAPVGEDAVLVPLVLRNRVAGALYADRTAEQKTPLDIEGLQVLTYIAALALETLPLRDRPATATLKLADAASVEEASEPAAAPAPQAEAVTAPATEEAPQPEPAPETPPATAEPTPTESAPVEASVAEPTPEPPPAAAPAMPTETPEPAPLETAPPAVAPTPPAEPEIEVEPAEEGPPLEDLEVEESEELEVGDLEVEELEVDVEEEVELDFDADMESSLETETAAPEEPATGVASEDVGLAESPAAEESTDARQAGFQMEEGATETAPPAAPPMPPSAPTVSDEEGTQPGTEVAPPSGGDGAAQVAPPSDVQGPGWAFGGSGGEERDGDEEARHQEARRLARLLVSEIKLYNEDQVLEGRRSQDICDRLKEDIEKSRQLYESRVDDRVRESTDYFYQEMVRVLGAGDPKTLGI